ncbi:MAG: cyclopropane-fatty-acyl-phospholipid synthase, partial [Quisquiliibacterium sp.]
MQVSDERVYREVFARWSLGLGETYMDGLWDCQQLDEFFTRLMSVNLDRQVVGPAKLRMEVQVVRHRLF